MRPRNGSRSSLRRLLLPGALATLCFVAAWVRLSALRASPYPTGVDGYWYLIQVRSLIEHGSLYYPSAPLVPWLMAAASLVWGPVLAVKSIAAVGSAAIIVPSYFLAKRLSGARGPALLGAALVATSAQSFFLCTEFVKQAVGLTFAVGFAAALGAALERSNKARIATAGTLLLACALAHKTALGLAVLFGFPPLALHLWQRRARGIVWVGIAVAAVLGLAVAWAAGREGALLGRLFHHSANLSFAVLDMPGKIPLLLGRESALAAGLAAVALGLAALPGAPRLPALAIGIIAFAIFQALPWLNIADDQGLGYRLRLCACVCLAPCSALVASQALHWARTRTRTALLSLLTCVVLLQRPWHSDEGVVKAHPAMVEATTRLAGVLPAEAVVIVPERHTAFMATWYGKVNTRLRPPAIIEVGHTFRLLPGAAIRPSLWAALEELRAHPVAGVAPSLDLHTLHPNGLVLLAENTFQYLVTRLPTPELQWYRDWLVQ